MYFLLNMGDFPIAMLVFRGILVVFQVVPRLLFFYEKKHPRHRHKPPKVYEPYRAVRTHSRQRNLFVAKNHAWNKMSTTCNNGSRVKILYRKPDIYIYMIYMIYIYDIYDIYIWYIYIIYIICYVYIYKYIYISHGSRFLKNYRLPLSWTYLNTENVTVVSVPEMAIKFWAYNDRGRYLPVRQKGRFLPCFAYNWRS